MSGCCWQGVGNVERERRRKRERERERERERRHDEDGGWGRERDSQLASQSARQKEKAALRTKDQFSEMTPNCKAFLLAKRILKPITATRVK